MVQSEFQSQFELNTCLSMLQTAHMRNSLLLVISIMSIILGIGQLLPEYQGWTDHGSGGSKWVWQEYRDSTLAEVL